MESVVMGKSKALDGRVFVRLSDEQISVLEQKVADSGLGSKSRLMRKFIEDGVVVRVDTRPIKQYLHLIRNAASNINQIAKRYVASGGVAMLDVLELKESVAALEGEASRAADCLLGLSAEAAASIGDEVMKKKNCCEAYKSELEAVLEFVRFFGQESDSLIARFKDVI